MIDPLTGAGNRRFIMSQLKSHILEASSRQGGVCLALLEIDQLKEIRNEQGIDIANEVLIGMQRRLRRAIRPTDSIARLDGDLFAVLMHYTNLDNYKQSSMERLRDSINQRPFKTSVDDIRISASIGVKYYRGDEEIISANEMVKQALHKLDEAIDMGNDSIAY